jgi:peptidoglycan LD-endopeptidase CwlK
MPIDLGADLLRIATPDSLHLETRIRVEALVAALRAEQIPLAVYESVRTPTRQANLYARGRVPGQGELGKTVTRAKAWQSLHQFGLAVDMVFRSGAAWSWVAPRPGQWERYHELARAQGLEPLSFEKPHVQLAGLDLEELRRGVYPTGGGDAWEQWLNRQIGDWGEAPRLVFGLHHPGAPPAVVDRPPLADVA